MYRQYRVTELVTVLGWVDLGLGSFPCSWAAPVATYYLGRIVEYRKSKSCRVTL